LLARFYCNRLRMILSKLEYLETQRTVVG
jgi:hypothetical protein